jgi:hypothetical protein
MCFLQEGQVDLKFGLEMTLCFQGQMIYAIYQTQRLLEQAERHLHVNRRANMCLPQESQVITSRLLISKCLL